MGGMSGNYGKQLSLRHASNQKRLHQLVRWIWAAA